MELDDYCSANACEELIYFLQKSIQIYFLLTGFMFLYLIAD